MLRTMKVLMLLGIFMEFGIISYVRSYNEDVKDILCTAYTAAEYVMKNMKGTHKTELEKAIYGRNDKALFSKNGSIHLDRKCTSGLNGRGLLCTSNSGGLGGDGCFLESLVGTFFCTCTPGSPIHRIDNLCGVNVNDYTAGTWYGGFTSQEGVKIDLFREVLEKIKKKCTEKSGPSRDVAQEVMNLKEAVDKVREKIEEKGMRGGFFYLGGSGSGACMGQNGNDICAAYRGKRTRADIPWADKIEKVIPNLISAGREKDSKRKALPRDSSPRKTTVTVPEPGESDEIEEQAVQTSSAPEDNSEQHENGEPQTGTSAGPVGSEGDWKRTKINTESSTYVADIPHLATYLNEDGSFFTSKKWPLLATLLI
ncbi:Variant surface glycoprotein [Trypanosoma congolense IL3000]|uniref:Variant surface glycoprotein n=1 Tax=Trypanosoma congolense (strain IL3000) TaxID=1068625 RepID=F9WIV5_TRYCI|nr:Variant surface glycoprotein [Trypanosoma congolense IL3000]